jgi:hypothetical protein
MSPHSAGQGITTIRFTCDKCGHRIKAPQESAGRKGYLTLPKDMVAFKSGDVEWRGLLTQSYAVFASPGGSEFLFVAPEDVTVRELGKARWSRKLNVEIRLAERFMEAAMSSQSLGRLEQWKAAGARAGPGLRARKARSA